MTQAGGPRGFDAGKKITGNWPWLSRSCEGWRAQKHSEPENQSNLKKNAL
jgi:hypothetical protein